MKKIALTLLLAMCAVSVFGQTNDGASRRMQAEVFGGRGLDDGTRFIAGANFVYGYDLTPQIYLGVGAGLRYTNGLYNQLSDAVTKALKNNYQTEYVAPVFLRARYLMSGINLSSTAEVFPYLSVDGGYALNLAGKPYDTSEDAEYEGNVKGVFISPQFGFDISGKVYIGVSYDFQRYNHRITSQGEEAVMYYEEPTFANLVTFHLGFSF